MHISRRTHICGLGLLLFSAVVGGEEIRLVTEKNLPGTLVGVTDDARLRFRTDSGAEELFSGDDVFTVEVGSAATPAPAGAKLVWLADGDSRLFATSVVMPAKGQVAIESALYGRAEFPLSALSAVRFPEGSTKAPGDCAPRLEALLANRPRADVFLAYQGEKMLELEGQLLELTASEVRLTYDGKDRTLTLGKLFAVVPAALKPPANNARGPEVNAELTDGSRLAGRLVKVEPDGFTIAAMGLPEITLKRSQVVRLYFASGRVVPIAELTPAQPEKCRAYVEPPNAPDNYPGRRPMVRNKPVTGKGKLRLDGAEFATGIGVHSYSELSYKLGGQFEKFTARIGIDDSAREQAARLNKPYGHVIFIVQVDGKEVGKWPLGVRDKSVGIDIPLTGADSLTLIVDYGDHLDVLDWADWAGARLLRKKK